MDANLRVCIKSELESNDFYYPVAYRQGNDRKVELFIPIFYRMKDLRYNLPKHMSNNILIF